MCQSAKASNDALISTEGTISGFVFKYKLHGTSCLYDDRLVLRGGVVAGSKTGLADTHSVSNEHVELSSGFVVEVFF